MAPFAVLPDWVQVAFSHGSAAVDLFFVLSGLVITLSLERAGGRVRPFLIARAARIFPVFLPVFALGVAVQAWSCGFDRMPWIAPDSAARSICGSTWPERWLIEIAAHLTMTHGLFPDAVLPNVWISFLGAAWSLSTEWQFYLLAVAMARRPGFLVRALFALAIAGVAWRLAGPAAWQFSRAFLPNKAQFFALGAASLPLFRHRAGAPRTGAVADYGVALALSVTICTTFGTVGKVLPPLAWTLCLLSLLRPRLPVARQLGYALRLPAAQFLGAISYCVYLVNEPLQKLIGGLLGGIADGNAMIFTLLWLPAATLLPILAAVWLHGRLEMPALRWGYRLAGRV
jgi:peptidoglycan/LPS O-acetylase OafA/YrhL